jgi:hypothetical protein
VAGILPFGQRVRDTRHTSRDRCTGTLPMVGASIHRKEVVMRRASVVGSLVILVLLCLGLAGSTLATDPNLGPEGLSTTGRVVFVVGGDVDVPAGDEADVVVVIQGDARIGGTVDSLVLVDGSAALTGATVGSVVLVSGTLELGAGTTVLGDVSQVNGTIVQAGGAVTGETRDLALGFATLGLFVGAIALVVWVGVGVATLLLALLLASFAGQQVRKTTYLIGREPAMVTLLGVGSVVVIPIVAALAMATLIGIPVGLGILLVAWPALAFVGYLVGAIAIGEWLLSRRAGHVPAPRPHADAVVGLIVAFLLGIIPFVTAIISLVGTGAVIRAAWYTWRGDQPVGIATQARPMPA